MRISFLFLAALALFACHSNKKNNRFDDPQAIRIGEFQDRRQTDSLLLLLNDANPTYRQWACDALASVQDPAASVMLGNTLLEDRDPSVRAVAAFALGQTNGYQAVNSLIPATTDANPVVRREALEALGKTIGKADLFVLTQFTPQDSSDEEGLAWALYRVGVRGLLDTLLTKKVAALLDASKNYQTQQGAAHTFARASYPLLPEIQNQLLAATASKWPEVRMSAGYALRKFVNEESFAALSNLIKNDPDYRVRVNATRSLRFFDWAQTQSIFPISLNDAYSPVSIAAADVIRAVLKKENTEGVLAWAQQVKNTRAQAHLFEGIMAAQASPEFTNELIKRYRQSTDDYQKSWLLAALSKSKWAVDFLTEELLTSSVLVIQSSAAAALVEINRLSGFDKKQKELFSSIYQKALAKGDVGVIISICDALKDSTLGYKDIIKDTQLF